MRTHTSVRPKVIYSRKTLPQDFERYLDPQNPLEIEEPCDSLEM